MTESKKTRTRTTAKRVEAVDPKPTEEEQGMRPVQFTDEPVETEPTEVAAEAEPEDEWPILLASSLVRNNEQARNSTSVRAVQDALIGKGYWTVSADWPGYWGQYTQDAAVAHTGTEDPVAAARTMGFTVI